jgi:hypothetical protein
MASITVKIIFFIIFAPIFLSSSGTLRQKLTLPLGIDGGRGQAVTRAPEIIAFSGQTGEILKA